MVRSTSEIALIVLTNESGVTEILSIPNSTKNCAKSGKSEGPCPHIPTFTPIPPTDTETPMGEAAPE